MKILMVLSSHDKLGDTGRKTGFWLEEFAAPYYVFTDAGAQVFWSSSIPQINREVFVKNFMLFIFAGFIKFLFL